ncbi:MAG: FtsQ-type POTRA domain-containing protein [Oscillospiraceae bacterium]|nr:FtsQ-type POTRA domain-containing protein [Oscillospiraceae bacterium]
MARRRRSNRRSNRGRFAFLYRLLTFVVICGAIVAALALFFKVETIEVEGAERYTAAEVIEASGVGVGDNLFLMDKYEVAARIHSTLNYVETVQISRSLPSTLRITVAESRSVVAVEQEDLVWLISGTGKIVDTVTIDAGKPYAHVTGLTLREPRLGRTIEADGDNDRACRTLVDLLERLRSKEMLGDVQEIHLEDASHITLRYLNRFNVVIPWDADMDYKLNYLLAVVEKLENNEHGTINMTQDRKVNFIPD